MSFYTRCVRPVLFRCDPEWIHNQTIALGEKAGSVAWGRRALERIFVYQDARLSMEVGGLHFPNPVGMAAGFDKSGRTIQALSSLGFGFVEIGSVSAHPSVGNAKPRLFRLPLDEAIVVNYGVPNDGAQVVAQRVGARPTRVPLGVNLVETNSGRPTDPDGVVAEYVEAVRPFTARADYIALNLNCPNTTGGISPFDDAARLRTLMQEYASIDDLPPVFLKFIAHSDMARMDSVLETVDPFAFVKGFVFNLPPGKAYALQSSPAVVDAMPGTLSGRPVRAMIDETIAAWYGRIDRQRHSIIGVGGITSAADAYRKIRLGASLVQLYTALVYRGPGLVRQINEGLVHLLERDGLTHMSEAVGIGD